MAIVVTSFNTEKEAQSAINYLIQADLGEVRARVLESSEDLSYQKNGDTNPMITPEMGSVEVRPSESPLMPEAKYDEREEEASGSIPATGSANGGVQVMIEVSDHLEERVRVVLSEWENTRNNSSGRQAGG